MSLLKSQTVNGRAVRVTAGWLLIGVLALSSPSLARSATVQNAIEQPGPLHLHDPWGVAFDPRSRVLYVTDRPAHRVLKLSLDGKVLSVWNKVGVAPGLGGPTNLGVDGAGRVYVEEAGLGRIEKFSPTGKMLARWNNVIPHRRRDILAMAVDARGYTYLGGGDYNSAIIEKRSPAGKLIWRQSLGHPISCIAVDPRGTVYASVFSGQFVAIQILSPSGKHLSTLHPLKVNASFMAIDATGTMYVSDGTAAGVDKISPRGTVVQRWPVPAGPLLGIATDLQGYSYVVTAAPSSGVYKLSPQGKILATWA